MPLVLVAVAQQIAVQLFDVVLGRRDVRPERENGLHDLGIASHFLLVARAKGLDLQVGQQALDLAVREPTALDPGRRADALDGGDPAQRRQSLGRQGTECPPGAFELVDLGDEDEHLGGNFKRSSLNHSPFLHPFTPVYQAAKTPDNTHFSVIPSVIALRFRLFPITALPRFAVTWTRGDGADSPHLFGMEFYLCRSANVQKNSFANH